MLEFKEEVLKFKLRGEPKEVRFPTLGELETFEKNAGEGDAKAVYNFLEVLGLLEEDSKKLYPHQLKSLLEQFRIEKKI